jgi:hypothetical protein
MFKKLFVLMVIMFAAVVCDLQAIQIDSTWVGDSEDNWGQSSNWDPAIVPDNDGNTFAVTIDSGGGYVRVGLLQWRTIDQLDCYGEVELQNYTSGWIELILVDANGLTNHGYLVIEGLEINGDVTNTAGVMLELEDMGIEGDLYNQAGATIEVFYEVWVDAVENAGSMVIALVGKLDVEAGTLHNTGQINIYGGACEVDDNILDNNDTGLIKGFGVLYADQLLRNKGQIYAYGGSLAISSEGELINEGVLGNYPLSSLAIQPANDVNNQGTIEVHAGGGVAFDCNLVNDTNGIIELRGGTLAATTITQTADANFAGFGGITGDILIESGAKIELTGPMNIVGDVNIPVGATLKISDGQTLITGHTTCDGTIHLIGGTVVFQDGCDCDGCNIINEAGIDRNHFDINADGTVNLKDFASFANTWLWQATWY